MGKTEKRSDDLIFFSRSFFPDGNKQKVKKKCKNKEIRQIKNKQTQKTEINKQANKEYNLYTQKLMIVGNKTQEQTEKSLQKRKIPVFV